MLIIELTKGKPGATKGGWLRAVENMETDVKVMQISIKTFYRLKWNSEHFGEVENYDEIIIRLVDFWDTNH